MRQSEIIASCLDRAIIAITKGKYDAATRAMCEAQRELGRGMNMIEKLESLEPMERAEVGVDYLMFRVHDLVLAGVDVNKWQKTTSS